MAMLDLSAVLSSPMLTDTFTVNRRTQTVGNNGRASTTVQAFTGVVGVVYPSDDNELKRYPDLQVQGDTITVITRFALRGESQISGTNFQPDLVIWNGRSYLVRVVNDYGNFGGGFIFAICTSITMVDQPPVTT
jgi:hypothetical protein